MDKSKVWPGLSALAWLLVACTSSPSESTRFGAEAGLPAEASTIGASKEHDASTTDAGASCNPYTTAACSTAETCCIPDSNSVFGTCLDLALCKTTAQFECSRTKGCGPDQVCCGTFVDSPNGDAVATTFCRKSCTAPAHETCSTTADCVHGGTCTALPEGGKVSIVAVAAEVFLLCLPLDGGTNP